MKYLNGIDAENATIFTEPLTTASNREIKMSEPIRVFLKNDPVTIMDAVDYEKYKHLSFNVVPGGTGFPYIRVKDAGKTTGLHRLIMDAPAGILVDHINQDTLDNRKSNLRLATRSQNMGNRAKHMGKSKYKGVCWIEKRQRWIAQIFTDGKRRQLGRFETEVDAAMAYNKAASEFFGEFAYLNTIKGVS